MGTTTNNGWTYPESTDLVKDGATAIQTLADDIDTTLGVYAPSTSGLTLINTTSFSGVSSQSVNDVFSTTYKNYKILFNSTTGALNTLFRLRVSGSDAATGYLANTFIAFSTATGTFSNTISDNATSAIITGYSPNYFSFDLVDVFEAANTIGVGIAAGRESDPRVVGGFFNFIKNDTTSYTGFTFFPASGTMTGSVSVYGYNK
jgi:hypothetical protein